MKTLTATPFVPSPLTDSPNARLAREEGRHSIGPAPRIGRPLSGTNPRRVSPRKKAWSLRIGHVHLKVCNLKRALPFYTDILGLRVTESVGRYAFLAIGSEHHSIALEEIGEWSVAPSRRAVGIAHVALEVPNREAFDAMRLKLLEANLPFISRNNGTSWAMRVRDYDGNNIEIYVDRRHSAGGSLLWKGHWYGPITATSRTETTSMPRDTIMEVSAGI